MNGFYAIYFTGATGVGNGVIALRDGSIVGADAAGGLYEGRYQVSEDSKHLEGTVTLTVPPGATLVTGAAAGSVPQSFEIPLRLPGNFADGRTFGLQTPTGPVNVIFKKLRGL